MTTTARPPRDSSPRGRHTGPLPTAADDGTPFRPLRLARRTPARIWAITLLFTFTLAGWSVLVPQYHAPDEPNHVDAVMRLEQGRGWPHPGSVIVTPDGVGAIAASPYGTRASPYTLHQGTIPQSAAVARADRPAWDRLAMPGQPIGGVQQIPQHPPLYYAIGAAVLRIIPGAGDHLRWDVTIGLLRLLSVLMVAPLPWLAWATAERLSSSRSSSARSSSARSSSARLSSARLSSDPTAATVAALVPLAVPELTHIGSSVTNDALLTTLGGAATLLVAYVLRGDLSKRTAVWVGLAVGLALFTKSLAVVLVPMALAAYLVAARRTRARFPLAPLAVASGLALAAGGWWWVVNVIRYHTFQPKTPGFAPGMYVGDHWHVFWHDLFQGMTWRWWGSIGWYEVNLPWRLVVAATAVVVLLFALGLIRADSGRVDRLFMLWPTVALFALVGGQAASTFRHSFDITGISGRYLYAGFVGIAVGVGAGAAALPRPLARWSPPLVLAAGLGMQAEAARLVGRHFWRPVGGGITETYGALSAWSPWPSVALKILALLIALAVLGAAAACVRLAAAGPRPVVPADP